MIPGTAIPTTRLTVDDSVQPTRPIQAVLDVLSEFSPGQRLIATIQSQLPNGTYRAMIAQRDVTLALPFSAKPGDSLELEVVNTDGRLTFAVAARSGEAAPAKEAVTATLSQTAQLIGRLQAKPGESGSAASPPALLNAGKPIIDAPPRSGAELTPLLQKAITESGVFYESHQAAWTGGRLPREALLREPQGQLPAAPVPADKATAATAATAAGVRIGVPPAAVPTTGEGGEMALTVTLAPTPQPASSPGQNAGPTLPPPGTPAPAASPASPAAPIASGAAAAAGRGEAPPPTGAPTGPVPAGATITAGDPATTKAAAPAALSLPPEVTPLVQQQLNALATNVFAWHGLAWPGLRLEWEIVDEDARHQQSGDTDAPPTWQTRLHLSLPSLGAVDATIGLHGDQVDIGLVARRDDARAILAGAGDTLRKQYETAGLRLASLAVATGGD